MLQPSDEGRAELGIGRDVQRLLTELSDDAAAVTDEARRIAAIEGARLKITFERSIARAITWTFLVIVGGLTGVQAGARLVSGMAQGIAHATGEVWAGDLLAGVILLGLLAGGGALFWTRRDKARLAELQRQFPEPSN